MTFTKTDIQEIQRKGLTVEKVQSQIERFKKGVPFANLVASATIGNGILALDKDAISTYINLFEAQKDRVSIVKFVPASGAATRMFKFLFKFLSEFDPEKESLNAYINRHKLKDLSLFRVGLEKFPFYEQVLQKLSENSIDFNQLPTKERIPSFVKTMLEEDALNFGNFPKGLLPFHQYNQSVSTAFEEHLFETALYTSRNKPTRLHFTISERYKNKFKAEFKNIQKRVERLTGATFDISFSYQHESTDTVAVTLKNEPFRDSHGQILYRPSGHGALINNLNALEADIIFIKNIDNVVVKKYKEEVATYKKVLAGILLELQKQTFHFIRTLNNETSSEDLLTISKFLEEELNVKISSEFDKYSKKYKVEYLKEKLNRPIRVCGMVKNEGEPGGGPFWVKDLSGKVSLQIIESAQINKKIPKQKEILNSSTHFNPVDVVCGTKNYEGKKFDLQHFVDSDAVFISQKTKLGKDLKALELPGLWNGGMAHWNTVFVEVPLLTFNPVKSVNDLLKPRHQIKD